MTKAVFSLWKIVFMAEPYKNLLWNPGICEGSGRTIDSSESRIYLCFLVQILSIKHERAEQVGCIVFSSELITENAVSNVFWYQGVTLCVAHNKSYRLFGTSLVNTVFCFTWYEFLSPFLLSFNISLPQFFRRCNQEVYNCNEA